MKNKIGLLFICTILFFPNIGGCSGDLSPQEAAEEIQKNPTRFEHVTLTYANLFGGYELRYSGDRFGIPKTAIIDKYKELSQQGYVSIIEPPDKRWEGEIIDFTDKAKPYYSVGKHSSSMHRYVDLVLGTIENVEVTGIKKTAENRRRVYFVVAYKPTPFGQILLGGKGLTRKGDIEFERYDDGWRMRH